MPLVNNIRQTKRDADIASTMQSASAETVSKYTFWGVMGHVPHDHMQKAFAQRREQIIGDNLQLKTDVDVYNDKYRGKNPEIQLVLDYTDDIAEREEMQRMRNRKDAA
jgi:hypothetical protein